MLISPEHLPVFLQKSSYKPCTSAVVITNSRSTLRSIHPLLGRVPDASQQRKCHEKIKESKLPCRKAGQAERAAGDATSSRILLTSGYHSAALRTKGRVQARVCYLPILCPATRLVRLSLCTCRVHGWRPSQKVVARRYL